MSFHVKRMGQIPCEISRVVALRWSDGRGDPAYLSLLCESTNRQPPVIADGITCSPSHVRLVVLGGSLVHGVRSPMVTSSSQDGQGPPVPSRVQNLLQSAQRCSPR